MTHVRSPKTGPSLNCRRPRTARGITPGQRGQRGEDKVPQRYHGDVSAATVSHRQTQQAHGRRGRNGLDSTVTRPPALAPRARTSVKSRGRGHRNPDSRSVFPTL